MQKLFIDEKVGGDGLVVRAGIQDDYIALDLRFPVKKALDPVRSFLVDKIKAIIPGTKFDHYADDAYAGLLKMLGIEDVPAAQPEQPAQPDPVAVTEVKE